VVSAAVRERSGQERAATPHRRRSLMMHRRLWMRKRTPDMRVRGSGGFTLLELLMVVIIIGILAAVGLPQYLKATEKARAAEALMILGAIRAAEIRYRAQSSTNAYTTLDTDLDVDFPRVGGVITLKYWTVTTPLTATGTGTGAVGMAVMSRKEGNFVTQTIGITFGSGAVCGTFDPYHGATDVPCTAN
jgi:prepilin-type N-terminal cleavage/methylation domain-containing protein